MTGRPARAGREVGSLLLALWLLVFLVGCGGGSGAGQPAARATPTAEPEEGATMDGSGASGPTALECGRPFRPPGGGNLALTGQFPAVAQSTDGMVDGTVEVTAADETVTGVVTPTVDVFLVRDGRVATLPVPQDSVGTALQLRPGEVRSLPGQAALAPCDPALAGQPLEPGTYELYARVVLNADDGTTVESVGGPWPLDVR